MNELLTRVAGVSIRIAILVAIVWLILALLKKTSAATRHSVWVATLTCAALMPLIGRFTPEWRMPQTLPALEKRLAPLDPLPPMDNTALSPIAIPAGSSATNPDTHINWNYVIAITWALGATLTLIVLALGWISARQVISRSKRVDDWRILDAVERGLRAAAIERSVDVRSTNESDVAFVFGSVSPSLVLPSDAELWTDETLSLVIAHELSHIRRNDPLAQRIAGFICALYWFHPAVWLCASRIRQESELACDDEVLLKGNNPASYAELLVTLAQSSRGAPSHVLAMARPGTLETRVVAALDKKRTRRNPKPFAYGVTALLVGLAVALGAAQPAQASLPPVTESPVEPIELPISFRTATREGVCGLGIPDEITYSSRLISLGECRQGMALITLTTRGGITTDVHATIGAQPIGDVPVLDSRSAAVEILSLVTKLDGEAASHAIQAASLMQNGATAEEILSIATDGTLAPVARRMAVTWFGIVAGETAKPSLLAIAKDRNTEASVREQALIALDLNPDELVDLFPSLGDEKLKQRVVNTIAGSADTQTKRRLVSLVSADADESFRAKALERLSR